jgi:hypothetical protein
LGGEPSGGPRQLKWIVLGCGGLATLGLLGLAGGVLVLQVSNRRAAEIAEVGAEYLKADQKIPMVLGRVHAVSRKIAGWTVETKDGVGEAYFTYVLNTEKGTADAEVWLLGPKDGPWQATGAVIKSRLTAQYKLLRIGKPGVTPKEYIPLE